MRYTWTGIDGQVYLGNELDAQRISWQVTDFEDDTVAAVMLPPDLAGHRLFAQPCPDPTGTRIATFAMPLAPNSSPGPAVRVVPGGAVFILGENPDELHKALHLGDAAPVHLAWHPDGTRLWVVQMEGGTLQLLEVPLEGDGEAQVLSQGTPLFYQDDKNGRLLVHNDGDYRADHKARVSVIDTKQGTRQTVCSVPGTFPAALWTPEGDKVVYAMAGDGLDSALMVAGERGEDAHAIMTFDGRATLDWEPETGSLLMAHGGDADLHFERIKRISLDGQCEVVLERELLAFWPLSGQRLLVATVNRVTEIVDYLLLSLTKGETRSVGAFSLTQEMRFTHHFFDQFRRSHPLTSPDTCRALTAGHRADGVEVDRSDPPQLWLLDLEGEEEPLSVAHAVFGCFAPCPPPA